MTRTLVNALHALVVSRLREMGDRLRASRTLLTEQPSTSTGLPDPIAIDPLSESTIQGDEAVWAEGEPSTGETA